MSAIRGYLLDEYSPRMTVATLLRRLGGKTLIDGTGESRCLGAPSARRLAAVFALGLLP